MHAFQQSEPHNTHKKKTLYILIIICRKPRTQRIGTAPKFQTFLHNNTHRHARARTFIACTYKSPQMFPS